MNAIAPRATSAVRQIGPVLAPQTFDQLERFAVMTASSDLVPRDYKGKPANIMVAVQMGSELGLHPMQSLQSIAVINGRRGVWGDGLIGLCRQSALCEDIIETFEGEGDARTAVCVAKRRGSTPSTSRFSVADAKKAGLWGKQGPWQQYPERMLQNRARGFALRDAFPDLLRGLKTVEELRDYQEPQRQQQAYTAGPTIDARAEPMQERLPARPRDAVDDDGIPALDEPPTDKTAVDAERFIAKLQEFDTTAALGQFLDGARVQAFLDGLKESRPDLALLVQQAEDKRFEELQAAEQVPA